MVKFRSTFRFIILMVSVLSLWGTGYALEREPDVIFVPTPVEVVMEMLNTAQVTQNDIVYDLGCGDGRIVITAAKIFGARGLGVDINPARIKESNANAQKIGVTDRVKFIEQDLFKTDLSEATVVFLYLLNELNIKLRPKLFKELKPGTRVVSHEFDMGDWKPDNAGMVRKVKLLYTPGNPITKDVDYYYWVIPANVAGVWRGTMTSSTLKQDYTLRLFQKFQEINGTMSMMGQAVAIADARLVGNQLTFTLMDNTSKEKSVIRFNGRVMGDTIQGIEESGPSQQIYDWTAKRNP